MNYINGRLTAKMEQFDSFWEAPENVEKGYKTFGTFYRHNYLKHIPTDKAANILESAVAQDTWSICLTKRAIRMCWESIP